MCSAASKRNVHLKKVGEIKFEETHQEEKSFSEKEVFQKGEIERVTLPVKASKRILKFNQACLMSHHYKGVQAPMEINGDFWQTRPYCQVQEIWFVLRCNSICAHTAIKSFNA